MSKKQNNRNPVAKHAEKFNKSQTFLDRKKEMKKGDYDSIDFDIEEIEKIKNEGGFKLPEFNNVEEFEEWLDDENVDFDIERMERALEPK